MAIKHIIRNSSGKLVETNLTPIKAIRKHCVECMGFSPYEVKGCTAINCALYPYRLGTRPDIKKDKANSDLLKEIAGDLALGLNVQETANS